MKKQLRALFLLLTAMQFAVAQQTVDLAMMQCIRDEGMKNSQVTMIAHNITDVCGPRLTNSPGYNCALDWVTAICNQWGLANAGREAWGEFGKGWKNEQGSLSLRVPYYENIIGYPVPWCKSTRKTVKAELIMLDGLDSASIDKAGESLKGKIVIFNPGKGGMTDAFKAFASRYGDTSLDNIPEKYMFTRKQLDEFLPFIKSDYYTTLYLEKKGAIGLLGSGRNSRDGTVFVDGGTGYKTGYEATLPEMKISREDFMKLVRLVKDGKPVQVEMNIRNTVYDDDLTGYNVVAEIPVLIRP
ncbi:MAG: hypothetical protein IPI66_13380 [Chitinophagaceae bacterium]|nr:hypothetical protein [Chitinophagaceae bacterium]